jgi:hypothetical protein
MVNDDKHKEQKKIWYQANKERIKAKRKKYYEENIDKIKEYRQENKEKIRESNYQYYIKNNQTINEKRTQKWKEKYDSDPMFKIKHILRTGVQRMLKKTNVQKFSKTELTLGCSFMEFKNYIESLWQPWMNWDNYGLYNGTENYGWDIDHIIPLSSAKTKEELLSLFKYTNCQPLCSKINRNIKKHTIFYSKSD